MPPYSYEVPHSGGAGHGPVRRGANSVPPLLAIPGPGKSGLMIYTSYENFRAAAATFPQNPYLGHREIATDGSASPYIWQTYSEVALRVDLFAAGLINLGMCPSVKDSFINNRPVLGLFSANRPEWVIAEQACFTYSIVPIPMYDSLTPDSFSYIVNQVHGLRTVVCTQLTLPVALAAKPHCPRLDSLIVISPTLSSAMLAQAKTVGVRLFTFDDVQRAGQTRRMQHTPPTPKDIMTFCYTSGTTGEPKGALITHENLLSNLAALTAAYIPFLSTDVHLSYLPLPHMMERMMQACTTWAGGAIGFFQGDTLKLLDDMQVLRPTIFPSVPRVLNRIKERVTAQVDAAGGITRALFNHALNSKLNALEQGERNNLLWDALVFNKVKAKLGFDRLRGCVTGSAPIPPTTLSWLRAVLGVPVVEGYGMTECTLVSTVQDLNDCTVGNVGAPIPCCELMLVDVPEMGYLSTDTKHGSMTCKGRGEVWMRGPSIFQGYYALPDKTAETVEGGWLKTGDIALWTDAGNLKIIDRKKNIFKLAQGEYVAPEKVEAVVAQSPFVLQSFVYGDSFKSSLVAVIVVNPDGAAAWAKNSNLKELVTQPRFIQAVLSDIQAKSAKSKLLGFEVVKAVHLEITPWTMDNYLTPTFKLKRAEVAKAYSAQIEKLYASISSKL